MTYKKTSSVLELENDIESGLVSAREYSDPELFLPMTPVKRLIKKVLLFVIRPFTRYQIIFNNNIFFTINKIYQYFLQHQARQEEIMAKYHKLEQRLKEMDKKLVKLR